MSDTDHAGEAEACLSLSGHYDDIELRNYYVAQAQVYALLALADALKERG